MSLHLSLPPSDERGGVRPDPNPQQISAWLARLRANPAMERARQMIDFLIPVNRSRMRVALRQEVTELVTIEAMPLLGELRRALDGATVPLATRTRTAVDLADELLSELAYSYKILLMEQSRRLFGLASSGRARVPVVRAMQLLAERLLLSYGMYATPPKDVWLELHALYHFALRRGFAQREANDDGTSPLDIYRETLLLAFAEPLKLMQGDLARVRAWIALYGAQASLAASNGQHGGRGVFLIKRQRDVPGYSLSKRQHPGAQQHDSILVTRALAEILLEQAARLDAGESPARIGLPECIDSVGLRDLLTHLARHWGGATSRRHERLRTHARVRVHIGIGEIWQFLNGANHAVTQASEWIITNEGAGGFALTHEKGQVEPIRVGDAIGLRMDRDDNCHICMVRWVLSDRAEHIEVGVEEMAPSARAASIRKVRDEPGRNPEPVLLLSEAPNSNQAPAILAPLVALDTTCELNLGELQSKMRVKATNLLERTVSVQLLQFSAVR